MVMRKNAKIILLTLWKNLVLMQALWVFLIFPVTDGVCVCKIKLLIHSIESSTMFISSFDSE